MKKKFLQIVSMVLTIVMILPTAAFAADYTIKVHGTQSLSVENTMSDASRYSTINWTSSDPSVATVAAASDNRKATVTGVSAGEATITAQRVQYGQNTGEAQTYTVEVTAAPAADGNYGNPGEDDVDTGSGSQIPDTQESSITISIDKSTIYDSGSNNTAKVTLQANGDIDESDIIWYSTDKSVAKVSGSGKTATVTGVSSGTASIKALCGDLTSNSVDIEVVGHGLDDFWVEENNYIERHYYAGDSFNTKGITAYAKYSDGETAEVTSYTVEPAVLTTETTAVTIKYSYNGKTMSDTVAVTVDAKVEDTVKKVDILTPGDMEVEVGYIIEEVKILVTWNSGKTEFITMTINEPNGVTLNNYSISTKVKKTFSFTASYGGVTSAPVTITVKEAPAKTINDMYVYTKPSKTLYTVNESLDLTGLVLAVRYSDDMTKYITKTYAANSSKISANVSKFTKEGTQTVTLTYKDEFGTATTTLDVTVGERVDVSGFANTSTYKAALEEDAKVKIGDELDWEDLFDYVYIKYSDSGKTKYKKISDNDDLEDWLDSSAKIYVIVSGKTGNDADTVEEDDIDDGEVALKLYLEYGGKTYSLSFDMKVSDVSATVTVYRSSSSSTKIGDSKVFEDLKEALEYLEDKDDIIDDFDISSSYKNSFVVKIKLGEDQNLSSFKFAPDHEQEIIIDLNGCELKMKSEWIDYDDCEDLKVIVTNTNEDEYGTVIYSDLSVTLVVAEDSELEFTEGEIPMDTDASCMVTLYRSSTSSTVIGTKIYESLKEALEALEEQDEVIEEYDISSAYEDTFVVKMKLGEDQNLSSFEFAPDYDTTISIDLNGCTLKLKSEWIDYDDCEDLVVNVNNTNADKKATMTYTDLSASLTIAKGDSALKFEEGKIPGLYTITVGSVTNGKVTYSPNKETAVKGSTVTFTITPNEGYEISSVKDGTKTISSATSGYTVSSKGVGTYKKENIAADITLNVTFKKTAASSSSSSSSSAANWTNPFTDVSKNAQYYDAVAFVCSEGLFNGMSATKFEPNTTMTRAMFVTVLGRLAKVDVSRYTGTSFTDVSRYDQQISWAAPYIEWAVQVGLTNGTGGGKFSPNDPITHQQMYLFMKRYADEIANVDTSTTGVSLSGLSDANQIADWAEEGVKFAARNNILITSGGKLTPNNDALRCELAMLLNGFCKNVLNK